MDKIFKSFETESVIKFGLKAFNWQPMPIGMERNYVLSVAHNHLNINNNNNNQTGLRTENSALIQN